MNMLTDIFGSLVFNEKVMLERLPRATYKKIKHCISAGERLDLEVADIVAAAMKDWAVEKGATHFTHWFQPMTGVTAEKHDSFISPTADGQIIMEFSGKELVRGEPDASSFPSGGLRATFEARGYTSWDPSSYAFIKDKTLCIPTAFCSYSGAALDKKTPLLRSMQAINKQALRILKLFGDDAACVTTTVGPEQEYFLVDKEVYLRRPDLVGCGRTLFGARLDKGQELDDHYFGTIKPRVAEFMHDLDNELWKLGVFAKTEHNEVAPAQHELAPIFTTTNIAADHNQITMELMKSVANKHGMICLLQEKPFAGVNGSGKHNNWSLSTDKGVNLLEPGETPAENARFILFLTAVIAAVDKHQDLLRISVASFGNDHRLGANEAPPAIVSVFLGDELTEILQSLENGVAYRGKNKAHLEIGVSMLPRFFKDATDRNRTSPFAFTGNKFEFRMLGSAASISCPNIMLNLAVADVLSDFADILEKADDFNNALSDIIRATVKEHKKIIFNGNNYSDNWIAEAKSRGLLNLKSSVDALPMLVTSENLALFEKFKVYSAEEAKSRYEILLENYSKSINIESNILASMVKRDILPSVSEYSSALSEAAARKQDLGADINYEKTMLHKISTAELELFNILEDLEHETISAKTEEDSLAQAEIYHDRVLAKMLEARVKIDYLESVVDSKYWRFPTYNQILYSVN